MELPLQRKSVLNMLFPSEHLHILMWLVTKDKHKILINHLQCRLLLNATGS